MKFALLGIDPQSLRVVRAIAQSDSHELAWFSCAGDEVEGAANAAGQALAAEVRRLAPLAVEGGDWTQLFSSAVADVVIVGGQPGNEVRFAQLRRLVQERVPVVVVHPITFSVLDAYELEAVREESGGLLAPLLTWSSYPKSVWFAGLVWVASKRQGADSAVGRVEQIVWERQLADRCRASVLGQFARDVVTLRSMCGEITQVAALGSSPAGSAAAIDDLSSLGVQMTGPAGILIRWNVQAPDDGPDSRITVVGSSGKHQLQYVEGTDPATWNYQYLPRGKPAESWPDERMDQSINLADIVAAGPGRPLNHPLASITRDGLLSDTTAWSEAILSLELVEALEKSLRKGRTITLSYEGRGETNAFKGTMASLGCGVLVVGLVLIVVAAVVLKVAEKTGNQFLIKIFKWWPAALLALLSLFLLLQLFRFVIPGDAPSTDAAEENADESRASWPRN